MTEYRDDLDDELLASLVDALPPEKPAPAVLDRLMKSVDQGRFGERFAEQVAAMLDVAKEKARALVDAIDDVAKWADGGLPGVSLYHVDGGPRVANAIAGFVRMAPGAVFPPHTHVGDEIVLIIQGGYVDSEGVTHRAGDEHRMPAGSHHSFTAAPGPDLVYLGVVQKGFTIGEQKIGPDSPDF